MAEIGTASIVMAYIVMAYIVMAYIVMAYIVKAYIVMADSLVVTFELPLSTHTHATYTHVCVHGHSHTYVCVHVHTSACLYRSGRKSSRSARLKCSRMSAATPTTPPSGLRRRVQHRSTSSLHFERRYSPKAPSNQGTAFGTANGSSLGGVPIETSCTLALWRAAARLTTTEWRPKLWNLET